MGEQQSEYGRLETEETVVPPLKILSRAGMRKILCGFMEVSLQPRLLCLK